MAARDDDSPRMTAAAAEHATNDSHTNHRHHHPILPQQPMPQQQMLRPIIFLDLDGVLNRTKHATHIRLDADLVDRLKRLVEATNAQIVLSTFWRYFHEYIAYILHRHGIDPTRIVGCTPGKNHDMPGGACQPFPSRSDTMMERSAAHDAEYEHRADEIVAWLQAHPEQGNWYVILDDRRTAAHQGTPLWDRFVHVHTHTGLTDPDVERAISILNREKKHKASTNAQDTNAKQCRPEQNVT